MPSKYLYVNAESGPNTFPTSIYGFAVYPGGALSPVPGFSPVMAQDYGGAPLVIMRDSKLLYTPYYDELAAFQINPDGTLTNAPSASFSMIGTPVGLVVHPTADLLYASSNTGVTGVLSVFAINSGTGGLNLTSSVSLGGNNIEIGTSAVITPDGKYLYQTDVYYPNGFTQPPGLLQIAGFSIDSATGALSALPGSPVSTMISARNVTGDVSGYMAIDPTGKFLYVSYVVLVNGASEGGVAAFSIDVSSGALTAVLGSPFSAGGSPTAVAIVASGRFLIVSKFPEAPGNCLDVFSIDSSTGALASVPGSPFGPAVCGFVAADPSGEFVYAGTGSETGPATVLVLSVDQTTGALTPVGQAAVPENAKLGAGFIAVTH
jgi:6-phosphogluconolactonase (cycloisomerase 2 family)